MISQDSVVFVFRQFLEQIFSDQVKDVFIHLFTTDFAKAAVPRLLVLIKQFSKLESIKKEIRDELIPDFVSRIVMKVARRRGKQSLDFYKVEERSMRVLNSIFGISWELLLITWKGSFCHGSPHASQIKAIMWSLPPLLQLVVTKDNQVSKKSR